MKNIVELLAPAGSFESLNAAINAGANAVYFGASHLNMRAKSINSFSLEDLEEIASICKENHVKTYLALNTVMYDHDTNLIKTVLEQVKKHEIDAVIATDFAVIELCRQLQIPLHISTQANVSNVETVQFFAPYSNVIVLARELTLTQTAHITREIERRNIRGISGELMKIEIFVHGALCMAISGKCYLSLHEQNASANRGACTQNCRRPYKVTDLETGNELVVDNEYIMSPKDLCTINILDEIITAGVTVLKIEGRGKSADYVYTVTRCYREALTAIEEGTYTAEKIATWMQTLETVYNRGFWEGYYLGRHLGEWTKDPGSAATEKKIYVAKGSNYFSKIGVAEFEMESGTLKVGDDLLVIGRDLGAEKINLNTLFVNGELANEAKRGDKVTFPFERKINKNDKLYKLVSANA
ncbi:MAG TPA: U32 family peptidase [Flavipsychrobacter sp.]|nr:U32 family peptidase [Flavipsychrobacter sp.]